MSMLEAFQARRVKLSENFMINLSVSLSRKKMAGTRLFLEIVLDMLKGNIVL